MQEINDFVTNNTNVFNLSSINKETKQNLISQCLSVLKDNISTNDRVTTITCIKILTRDASILELLTTEAVLECLLKQSHISDYAEMGIVSSGINIVDGDAGAMVEALKCMNNIVFNSKRVMGIFQNKESVLGILNRMHTYSDPDLSHYVKFYDLRLLFLLTALCPPLRADLLKTYRGLEIMGDVLESMITEANKKGNLDEEEASLLFELLKVMFNAGHSLTSVQSGYGNQVDEYGFSRMVTLCRDLLFIPCNQPQKRHEMISLTVNFLTTVTPHPLYKNLLLTDSLPADSNHEILYKNPQVMKSVSVLLKFLSSQLDQTENMKEAVGPILQLLSSACRNNRQIRKYCRQKILPKLRKSDVEQLPEVGSKLRNKLCRFLTNTIGDVTEMTAYFLFILCKESVERAIKYTGYGNFSGYLCRHGLMAGVKKADDKDDEIRYSSSDSEDSDTEEYEEVKNQINPVTGRVEEEKPDPFQGMSDERKEYEAMKLVEKIDQLQRAGVITPGVIGEDGRVRPAEHVLELLENSQHDQNIKE